MRILVTGARGQVGSELKDLSGQYKEIEFIWTDRDELDLSRPSQVKAFVTLHKPDWVFHCGAYTAVDKAEMEPEVARTVNALSTEALAQGCQISGSRLLLLSTDYVYHGQQNAAYRENDVVNPVGVYAKTKYEGEVLARQACERTLIFRTSWVYSSHGHNFVKTMLKLGKERGSLKVVADQIGSPTYARDLARAMLFIALNGTGTHAEGVYHYSNEGVCSWYDFAKAIFDIKGLQVQVQPIDSIDFPTPAKRPPFSLLHKGKIKENFGIEIPYWRDSLKECLELLP